MIYHKSATHRDFTGFEALSKQVLSETFQKNQSAPQNGLEALCLCGFPEPGFQNLLPARGRKRILCALIGMDESVSKSSPRKGTETKASLEASRKAVLVSKSSPRKGTETHLLFLWIIVKEIVSKSSPRKGP